MHDLRAFSHIINTTHPFAITDIEDLGVTTVSCPWHKFLVSVTDGTKVYQQVDIENGVPKVKGWKVGTVVQRAHKVIENDSGVYLSLQITDEPCQSDKDACSARCAQDYSMHQPPAEPQPGAPAPSET